MMIIGFKDKEFLVKIGCAAHEKAIKQKILLTVKMQMPAPKNDELSEVFDVNEMFNIVSEVSNTHFNLIETLCVKIHEEMKKKFNTKINVSLYKKAYNSIAEINDF